MNITAKTKICMIIGDPVEYSLSPQLHNAGYKALGIGDEYVYVAIHVLASKLPDFIKGVKSMQIAGVGVKTPHKIKIIKHLDEVDEIAQKIGSVNSIVNTNEILKGYNTDWLGVVSPLEKITSLENKKVALLGAGGVSRAAAYGLSKKGANITIYNRTIEKAEELAKEFGGVAKSFDSLEAIKGMDIIINATSIGHPPYENEMPVGTEFINDNQIIYDLVYSINGKTKLIEAAEKKGAKTISGIEMLLHQGYAQFKLFTGHDAPVDAMRNALLTQLK